MSRIMSDGAERKGSACVAGDSGEKDGDAEERKRKKLQAEMDWEDAQVVDGGSLCEWRMASLVTRAIST